MAETSPRYLVVGADSMIGSALIQRLESSGARVLGTTRRRERAVGTRLHLDLLDDVRGWHPPEPVDAAILCAGVTGLQACRADPAGSARVNVQGIAQLAANLLRDGAFVVYLSTNQVFDGSVPFRAAHDAPCPITAYGRQKAEAERLIQEAGGASAIVRFTKVLGPQMPLFANWTAALRRGERIHAYSNLSMAPVPLFCAVDTLQRLADRRIRGVFQVSGERDISYETAAQIGAKAIGAKPDLVQSTTAPVTAGDEPIPIHTTLNTETVRSILGITLPEVEWTVETAFANPLRLGGLVVES